MARVNLDHQSATPILPEALEAMQPYWAEYFGNPSSLHEDGRRAREAIDTARAQMAALIGAASPAEIIFTSDGTESANLAIQGTAWANQRRGNHIILSQIEHPSVLRSVEFLEQHGFTATRVRVDGLGRVDPAEVKAAITDKTILIATHHAHSDLGTVQAVAELSSVAQARGITFYVDADASVGWLPVEVEKLGADLLSFSAQRFYAPKGVGVLYRQRRARLTSLHHGGNQEEGLRAGTENIPAIVGAGAAAAIALQKRSEWSARCYHLQQRLWNGLRNRIELMRLNGPDPGPHRSPVNLNIATEFVEGESQVLLCDRHGISIAGATQCIGQTLAPSPVLQAIGLSNALALATITLSLGKDNTEAEVDYVIETLAGITTKLRKMSPSWQEYQKGE